MSSVLALFIVDQGSVNAGAALYVPLDGTVMAAHLTTIIVKTHHGVVTELSRTATVVRVIKKSMVVLRNPSHPLEATIHLIAGKNHIDAVQLGGFYGFFLDEHYLQAGPSGRVAKALESTPGLPATAGPRLEVGIIGINGNSIRTRIGHGKALVYRSYGLSNSVRVTEIRPGCQADVTRGQHVKIFTKLANTLHNPGIATGVIILNSPPRSKCINFADFTPRRITGEKRKSPSRV